MSVIIKVAISAADFRLGQQFQGTDTDRVELEQLVPTTDSFVPFFRVYGADFDALEDELTAHEGVVAVELLDDFGDSALFGVEWDPDTDGLFDVFTEHNAALLSAVGRGDRWTFELRFPEHADVLAFQASCTDADIPLTLLRRHSPTEPDADVSRLTSVQHDTLVTALEDGYFSVPRRTNLTELAEKLGVSDQAVSERLRRAETRALTSLLLPDEYEKKIMARV